MRAQFRPLGRHVQVDIGVDREQGTVHHASYQRLPGRDRWRPFVAVHPAPAGSAGPTAVEHLPTLATPANQCARAPLAQAIPAPPPPRLGPAPGSGPVRPGSWGLPTPGGATAFQDLRDSAGLPVRADHGRTGGGEAGPG
ncbi:hypothetical protein KRM28CT15_09180 [Krasilnikovia sp. M28-CT-15]